MNTSFLIHCHWAVTCQTPITVHMVIKFTNETRHPQHQGQRDQSEENIPKTETEAQQTHIRRNEWNLKRFLGVSALFKQWQPLGFSVGTFGNNLNHVQPRPRCVRETWETLFHIPVSIFAYFLFFFFISSSSLSARSLVKMQLREKKTCICLILLLKVPL